MFAGVSAGAASSHAAYPNAWTYIISARTARPTWVVSGGSRRRRCALRPAPCALRPAPSQRDSVRPRSVHQVASFQVLPTETPH